MSHARNYTRLRGVSAMLATKPDGPVDAATWASIWSPEFRHPGQ